MKDISVCMISYNHEKFIEQSLVSILEQETRYSFEIIIVDDRSNDATAVICAEVASKHPDKVRFIQNETNIGMMPNFIKALRLCKGRYTALCDGDDYWNDKKKLQQTIDVLEKSPECTLCCHGNYRLVKGKLRDDNMLGLNKSGFFSLENYLLHPFFHTSSMVFRTKELHSILPDWYKDVFAGDNFLVALLASKGGIYYIAKPMSVYRVHTSSISNKYGIINMRDNYFKHLELFNEMSDMKYTGVIEKLRKKWEILTFCYENTYRKKVKYFFQNMPEILAVYKSLRAKAGFIFRYLLPK